MVIGRGWAEAWSCSLGQEGGLRERTRPFRSDTWPRPRTNTFRSTGLQPPQAHPLCRVSVIRKRISISLHTWYLTSRSRYSLLPPPHPPLPSHHHNIIKTERECFKKTATSSTQSEIKHSTPYTWCYHLECYFNFIIREHTLGSLFALLPKMRASCIYLK
jgi:hypothetical protein